MKSKTNLVVPDGGWGWMVVLGVALTYMFNQALNSLFGLIFGEALDNMGHGTAGAALVMNVCSVITNFSGLITGPAIKRFTYRKIAIFGSLLIALGFILCSFAHTMWQIIISYSVFAGLGLGFIMPSTFVAINSYFTTRRGRAVGIAMAGTGLGQMLMPHVVRFFLDGYGFRGTTLLLGALALHGVAGGALLQPVKWHMKKSDGREHEHKKLLQKKKKKPEENGKNGKIENGGDNRRKSAVPLEALEASTTIVPSKPKMLTQVDVEANEEKVKPTCWERFIKFMDLELLKDPVFISISIGISLVYTANSTFSMLFPYYLQETAGLTRGETAMCMSALAASDIVSRLTLPSITYKLKMSARSIFVVSAILIGVSRSVIAEQTDFTTLMIISGLSGYVRAATVMNQNLTLSEYCTQEKLPAALGLNMCMKGITIMILGQATGWLRDFTGSFSVAIHALNILLVIMAIMWTPEMIYRKIKNKNEESS